MTEEEATAEAERVDAEYMKTGKWESLCNEAWEPEADLRDALALSVSPEARRLLGQAQVRVIFRALSKLPEDERHRFVDVMAWAANQ